MTREKMRTKWIFSGTRGASCSVEFVCRIRQKNRFPRDRAGRSRQAKQPAATTGPLESGKGNYSDASSSPSDVLFTALIHGVQKVGSIRFPWRWSSQRSSLIIPRFSALFLPADASGVATHDKLSRMWREQLPSGTHDSLFGAEGKTKTRWWQAEGCAH